MTGLRGLLRVALAGALACLLTACWMSAKPLLTEKTASTIGFAGTYRGDRGDDGPLDLTFVSVGGTAYAMTNETGERIPVRFLPLRGDWYLMQYEGHSDEEGGSAFYIYMAIRHTDGDLHLFSSNCEDVSGKFKGLTRETAFAGATDEAGNDNSLTSCNFSRLSGLKSAALAYVARIENGDLSSEEPEILERVGDP